MHHINIWYKKRSSEEYLNLNNIFLNTRIIMAEEENQPNAEAEEEEDEEDPV